ncbi:MAG: NfeD family protein [Pseudomonadota bacterium]|nr:MAG: NfeD family protein [Pseudomonadota bacterium]
MNPVIIWFLIGLALVLAELAVPGVILIFFGIGAWVAALTTWLDLTTSLDSQLMVFAITSVVLLVLMRRWIKGRMYGHVTEEQDLNVDLDEFVGYRVTVTQTIEPGKGDGRVEFKGAPWNAMADESIAAGEQAVIEKVDGITLKVRKG